MEVMFGGFEDWGWWLVVLGCWDGQWQPWAGSKLANNNSKSSSLAGGKGLLKVKRRRGDGVA